MISGHNSRPDHWRLLCGQAGSGQAEEPWRVQAATGKPREIEEDCQIVQVEHMQAKDLPYITPPNIEGLI